MCYVNRFSHVTGKSLVTRPRRAAAGSGKRSLRPGPTCEGSSWKEGGETRSRSHPRRGRRRFPTPKGKPRTPLTPVLSTAPGRDALTAPPTSGSDRSWTRRRGAPEAAPAPRAPRGGDGEARGTPSHRAPAAGRCGPGRCFRPGRLSDRGRGGRRPPLCALLFLYRRERGRQRAHGCGAWREFSWNRASPRPSFPPADDGRSRERRLRSRLSGRNVVTRLRPAARSRGNGVSSHFFPPEIPTKRRARHSLPWSPSTRNPSSRSGAGSPSARFCCLRVRCAGW